MQSHSEDAAKIVERVATLAMRTSSRVAVAESLTSGNIAAAVGAGTDASTWFAGAMVAYQQDVKERMLGVPAGTDPCSAACAEQLARGIRELLDSDVAVSATGVGGPDPEDGHPPGTVFLGWATSTAAGSRYLWLRGEPTEVVNRTTVECVRLLVEVLDGAA